MATSRLEIRLLGLDKLQAGINSAANLRGGFATSTRSGSAGFGASELKEATRILERQSGLLQKISTQASGIGQTMARGFQKAETASERLRRTEANNQARLQQQRERNISRRELQQRSLLQRETQFQRTAALRVAEIRQQTLDREARTRENALRRQERRELLSIRRRERAEREAQARITRQRRRAARAVGGTFTATGRGLGGALSRSGAGIGGALTGILGGGGGLISGTIRGAGGLASAGLTAGADLAGSLASGLTSQIPLVGKAFGGLVEGGLKAASGLAGGVLNVATDLGARVAGGILTGAKVALVAGLGLAVAAGARAVKGEQIRTSFEAFTKAQGEDAVAALDSFKRATSGAVTEMDLMLGYQRALQLGAVQNADDFAKLSGAAIRLGAAMGRSPKDALEDLTLGFGRQSRLILDNLGIIVSAEAAYERYGQKIGKAASALSDSEKRIAFTTEATRKLVENQDKLGNVTETTSFKFARLKTSFLDLLEAAGRPLLDILSKITPQLTRMARRFTDFLNENKTKLAAKLSSTLEGLPNTLKKAADILERFDIATLFRLGRIQVEKLGLVISDVFSDIRKELKLLKVEISESTDLTQILPNSDKAARQRAGRRSLRASADVSNRFERETNRQRRIQLDNEQREIFRSAQTGPVKFAGDVISGFGSSVREAGLFLSFTLNKSAKRFIEDFSQASIEVTAPFRSDLAQSRQLRTGRGGDPFNEFARGGQLSFNPLAALLNKFGDLKILGGPGVQRTEPAAPGRFPTPRVFVPQPAQPGIDSFFKPGRFPPQLTEAQDNANLLRSGIRAKAGRLEIPQGVLSKLLESTFDKIGDDIKKLRGLGDSLDSEKERLEIEEEKLRLTERQRDVVKRNEEDVATFTKLRSGFASDALKAEREIKDSKEKSASLAERAAAIEEERAKRIAEVTAQAEQRLQQSLRSARIGFARNLESAQGDRALPRNIRKGFEKAGRIEDSQVRDRLRREFGRFSSGEIARSPELRARIEAETIDSRFDAQQPIRIARENEVLERGDKIGPLREQLADLRARSSEELTRVREAIEAQAAADLEGTNKEIAELEAIYEKAVESREASEELREQLLAKLEEINAETDRNKKEIEKITRGVELTRR